MCDHAPTCMRMSCLVFARRRPSLIKHRSSCWNGRLEKLCTEQGNACSCSSVHQIVDDTPVILRLYCATLKLPPPTPTRTTQSLESVKKRGIETHRAALPSHVQSAYCRHPPPRLATCNTSMLLCPANFRPKESRVPTC